MSGRSIQNQKIGGAAPGHPGDSATTIQAGSREVKGTQLIHGRTCRAEVPMQEALPGHPWVATAPNQLGLPTIHVHRKYSSFIFPDESHWALWRPGVTLRIWCLGMVGPTPSSVRGPCVPRDSTQRLLHVKHMLYLSKQLPSSESSSLQWEWCPFSILRQGEIKVGFLRADS